ncbi:MAG: ABC transporter substrate-binding protein [Chloroflexi bacterium]|nr:ABC transporter substrate-binding protein [Chloroflexota bacterium]
MHRKTLYIIFVIMMLAALLLSACGGDKDDKSDGNKTYRIGILAQSPTMQPLVDGFKAHITESGYREGENLTYVFSDFTGSIEGLKPEAEKLKAQQLDLLLTLGTPAAQTAKEVFADTDVPILFGLVLDPVASGLVESFRNPGGNLTGVQSIDTMAKSLEWLLTTVPDIKQIYVPHNPEDNASVQSLAILTTAAEAIGVKLVVSEGSTAEELDAITQTIPENVDAVFILRSSSLSSRSAFIAEAAKARQLPSACSDIGVMLNNGIMLGYGPGYPEMGQQLARIADQILKGSRPADLPVETPDVFLGINLQTAQLIGVVIPDAVIQQAKNIIRPTDSQ